MGKTLGVPPTRGGKNVAKKSVVTTTPKFGSAAWQAKYGKKKAKKKK